MTFDEREELLSTIFRALRDQGFSKADSYDCAEQFADACEEYGIVVLEIEGGVDEQAEETGT